MKKIVTLMLVLIMTLSMTVLSGCGDDKATETKKPTPTLEPSVSATAPVTTESATQEPDTTTSAETTAPTTTAPAAAETAKPVPTATQKPSTPTPTATAVVKTDAELILGKWEATVDFGLAVKNMYATMPDVAAYAYLIESLPLKTYYEFKADGSYKDYPENGYADKLEELFGNFYKGVFTVSAESANKTVEQALSEIGYATLDDYIADLLAALDLKSSFPEFA